MVWAILLTTVANAAAKVHVIRVREIDLRPVVPRWDQEPAGGPQDSSAAGRWSRQTVRVGWAARRDRPSVRDAAVVSGEGPSSRRFGSTLAGAARGGWLLVDRVIGHVSPAKLAEFDAYDSAVGCYRDSVADGGVSEDGEKKYALGTQLCRGKPILKKEGAVPDSDCVAPVRQRGPVRVRFEAGGVRSRRLRSGGPWWIWRMMRRKRKRTRLQSLDFRLQIADCRLKIEEKTVEYGTDNLKFLQSPAASTAGSSSAIVFSLTLALVTRMTDSTTIALPARMKRSTRSCRISQPRNTATTGFTYA